MIVSARHILLVFTMLSIATLFPSCTQEEQNPRYYVMRQGNFYGYMDADGEPVIGATYNYAMPFSEGLAAVNVGGTPYGKDMPVNGKWGFINKLDTFVINPNFKSPPNGGLPVLYDQLSTVLHEGYIFSEGFAAVYTEDNEWVYIDHSGKPRIQGLGLQSARRFVEGLAAVCQNGRWGYIDTTGHFAIAPQYLFPLNFKEGYAMVFNENQEMMCIDKAGIRRFEYYRLMDRFHQGIAPIKANLKGERIKPYDEVKFSVINEQGDQLFEPQFEDAGRFGEGLIPVLIGADPQQVRELPRQISMVESEGGRWGYADLTGKIIINPLFQEAKGFSEGLAGVKVNGSWGFINRKGKIVIEPGFRRIDYFQNGFCRVTLGTPYNQYFNKFALINRSGDIIYVEK